MLPNLSLDKAFAIANSLVSLGKNSQHQDYARTVELAKTYKQFITGKDMDDLYQAYDRRESPDDLKQTIRLTNPLTPAVCSALSQPLRKLSNVLPRTNTILYADDTEQKRAKALREVVDAIKGDNDLASAFAEFLEFGLMDPNAFVLWTFENYDNRFDKPQVFSSIQPSADVWNFEYKSDILQWLFLHKTIKYVSVEAAMGQKQILQEGEKFIFYTANNHVVYEQVRPNLVPLSKENILSDSMGFPVEGAPVFGPDSAYYIKFASVTYRVTFYNQNAGRVPAFRLGYKDDGYTNGRTCVNLWHAAYYQLRALVKLGRENDLSYYLHAFLQKISYDTPCMAQGCNGGQTPEGGMCGACKGTGKSVATTASDHISLALPRKLDPNMMVDLDKLVRYVTVPTDILTIQDKKISEVIASAIRAVYNSDTYITDTTVKTATEGVLDMQSVYDVLQDPAAWWSNSYMDSEYVIAEYHDMGKGLTVIHRFPRDFKFESTTALLNTMQLAKNAGASSSFISQLNDDLLIQQFQDDPYQLARVQTMTRFDPFAGKTEDVVLSIFGQGLTTKANKVLWSNMPIIFDDAEALTMSQTPPVVFYDLNYSKQRIIIDELVNDMLEELDSATVAPTAPMTLGAIPEPDPGAGETTTADPINTTTTAAE